MNPFVNYQQRTIDLPAGCKDLIDVLRMEYLRDSELDFAPAGRLGDIERYVSRQLNTRAKFRRLTISCSRRRDAICLALGPFCPGHGPWPMSISVSVDPTKPTEERAVRRVFDSAGISPLIKTLTAVDGLVRSLHYPLPSATPDACRIIADVLRSAFAVTEQSLLWFDYLERHTVSELI